MKIAINGILLKHLHSGVEISILNLARALAEFGSEQYILHVPGTFPVEDIVTNRFATQRAPLYTRFRPFRILWEQFALPNAVAMNNATILHSPGYLAPLRAGVPVVITVYDMIALRFPNLCRPANALNYRMLLPASIRRAARVIVPSEATRRDLLDAFPSAESKTHVIHLGIDTNLHPVAAPEALAAVRTRFGLPERFILFTGRQEPKKNLVRLVEAFHILRNAGAAGTHKLVLAGAPDRDTPAIERRIAALGLGNEVILPGFVPHPALPALYSAADLFVFPSLCEGFGLPPLEAMACGTPVVASNHAAVREITGGAAALVEPTSPAAIANAMKEVLTSRGIHAGLVAAGIRRAAGFSWQKTAQATESLYTAVNTPGSARVRFASRTIRC